MFSYVKFSVKKQTFFAKKLSFLIKAGISLLESLHLLKEQTRSKKEIQVINKLIEDVSNGQSLANSIKKQKGLFGNFAINLIHAGESSGTLTQNLAYLADELKKKDLLRKKIMGAMIYPIIITIATFGITGLLIIYIFPKILPIFVSLKAELPLSTRMIIYVSDIIRQHGLWILLGLIVFMITMSILVKKISKLALIYDRMILRIPIVGTLSLNYNLTNIFRTLGLLLKSGTSLSEALAITSDTTENAQYKKFFIQIQDGLNRGKKISEMLSSDPFLFPEMSRHMISVGERTGNLSNTLIYLAEYYENEFEEATKNLSSSIEPVLMIIMGLIVGFVAISVITPIYAITNNLKR
jgi:type IV pilus assembly protein PilC